MTKEEADKVDKNGDDPEPKEDAVYKFKRNFTNNEILKIMEDFLQGKKLLQSRMESRPRNLVAFNNELNTPRSQTPVWERSFRNSVSSRNRVSRGAFPNRSLGTRKVNSGADSGAWAS